MSGTGHTVKSYEEEMQSLNDNLVMMGSLTENQMADAMAAVIKVDKESVDKIVKNDGKINELRSTIDNQITTVLVKRAPMAVDLRITISTMKISHDLERIGDLDRSIRPDVCESPNVRGRRCSPRLQLRMADAPASRRPPVSRFVAGF